MDKEWFTSGEAAEYLGFSEISLRKWRVNSRGDAPEQGPRFYKPAGRIRYAKADLDDFLRSSPPDPMEPPKDQNLVSSTCVVRLQLNRLYYERGLTNKKGKPLEEFLGSLIAEAVNTLAYQAGEAIDTRKFVSVITKNLKRVPRRKPR